MKRYLAAEAKETAIHIRIGCGVT